MYVDEAYSEMILCAHGVSVCVCVFEAVKQIAGKSVASVSEIVRNQT